MLSLKMAFYNENFIFAYNYDKIYNRKGAFMNRHNEREKAMICVYQNLLTNKDVKESLEDIFLVNESEISEFARSLVYNSIENKQRYAGYINEVLNGWTFDRLGYLEQAILLLGCTEFDLKMNQMAVIIDEAVILAKKYCDEDAYKLINGVLEKL